MDAYKKTMQIADIASALACDSSELLEAVQALRAALRENEQEIERLAEQRRSDVKVREARVSTAFRLGVGVGAVGGTILTSLGWIYHV